MRVSADKLVRALAQRLDEVVPAPFTLRPDGDTVSLFAGADLVGGSTDAAPIEATGWA